jgi:hypothetical protein
MFFFFMVKDENSKIWTVPAPLIRGTDSRIRIRTKVSRIHNTGPGCRSATFNCGSGIPRFILMRILIRLSLYCGIRILLLVK